MATKVAGDLYVDIDGQMWEIKRQLRQKGGYPYDPMHLVEHLQAAIEGNLVGRNGQPFKGDAVRPLLLETIDTVTIPATITPFVVQDKFVVGNVGIVYVSEYFKAQFLGKTEEPTAEMKLRYSKLVKSSADGPILVELGDKAETTLAQVFALLERQKNGEEGVLLTNGWASIFYVNGRAVGVYWDGDGWYVNARSVSDPYGWSDGHRVFSRDS